METNKVTVIANCSIGFEYAWRTLYSAAVTETLSPTPIVIATFVSLVVAAVVVTARTLTGTAQGLGAAQRAGDLVTGVLGPLRPAAGLKTVLLPATVTLLSLLHNSITANGNFRL